MRARWRDPRIAPVYAAVLAFAVVGVFGLVSGHRSSTIPEVRLVAAGAADLPQDLAVAKIDIREPGAATAPPVASGQFSKGAYTPAAAVSGRLLCVHLPAPWSLTGATDGCLTAPEPKSGAVTLTATRGVLVRVTLTQGEPDQSVLQDVVVTVRSAADTRVAESGRLDNTGVYQPQRSLAKQQVCLTVPNHFRVSDPHATPEKDSLFCLDPVADEHQDIPVTLTRGA